MARGVFLSLYATSPSPIRHASLPYSPLLPIPKSSHAHQTSRRNLAAQPQRQNKNASVFPIVRPRFVKTKQKSKKQAAIFAVFLKNAYFCHVFPAPVRQACKKRGRQTSHKRRTTTLWFWLYKNFATSKDCQKQSNENVPTQVYHFSQVCKPQGA